MLLDSILTIRECLLPALWVVAQINWIQQAMKVINVRKETMVATFLWMENKEYHKSDRTWAYWFSLSSLGTGGI